MAGRIARCTSKNEDDGLGDDHGQTPSFDLDGFAQFACRDIASCAGYRTDAALIDPSLSISSDDEGRGCADCSEYGKYLIWLPFIASLCSTTSGALMFPVELQNAARMVHEVGPSLTTVDRRRKHPCIKRCLHTQGRLDENMWRAECVQYACRKTGNVWKHSHPHHAPQSSPLDTCCYHQSVPKSCLTLVIIWQPPKPPTHSCIV